MSEEKKKQKKRVHPQKNKLTLFVFIGLFIGLLWGIFFPEWVFVIEPFQNLFLRGVKCAIAPLIFSTIVVGIASAGSFKQLGMMGIRTFVYFEVITTLALIIGLVVVNMLQPGIGLNIQMHGVDPLNLPINHTPLTFAGFIEHLLPYNFAEAIMHGEVLQIVILSTIFSFATLSAGVKAQPILSFCEALAEIMFKFVQFIMYLAPFGVCAALASAVGKNGWHVIFPLVKLVATLYTALAVFVFMILLPVAKIFRVPVLSFLKQVKDPILLAFATTSSESAYPLALENLTKLGIPRRVATFVLPMGYSFNLDGSTLYLSLASVFIAQVAGIHLSLSQQLLIMLTLMLTTKGVAAVPRTSIVVLSGTLTAFGLPIEGIALILGVDVFMDMGRSAINLLGNCLAAAVIARLEGIELKNKE